MASPASRLASLQGEMRPQPACICLNAIRLHRFLTDSELRLCIARSTARVAASVSTVTRQQANCVTGATRVPTVLRASAPVLSGLPRQPPLQALCSQTESKPSSPVTLRGTVCAEMDSQSAASEPPATTTASQNRHVVVRGVALGQRKRTVHAFERRQEPASDSDTCLLWAGVLSSVASW